MATLVLWGQLRKGELEMVWLVAVGEWTVKSGPVSALGWGGGKWALGRQRVGPL